MTHSHPPITLSLTSPKEPRVDSRDIATHLGVKHRSLFKNILTYQSTFEELGKVRFEIAALTHSRTGQRVSFAMLNEDQAYLLLTMSRNTPRVVELKVALVKAFRESRMALAAYKESALPSFVELQEALQRVPGGATQWTYSNVNKLINSIADIPAKTRIGCAAGKQALITLLHGTALRAVQGAQDAKDAYARIKASLAPYKALTVA